MRREERQGESQPMGWGHRERLLFGLVHDVKEEAARRRELE